MCHAVARTDARVTREQTMHDATVAASGFDSRAAGDAFCAREVPPDAKNQTSDYGSEYLDNIEYVPHAIQIFYKTVLEKYIFI